MFSSAQRTISSGQRSRVGAVLYMRVGVKYVSATTCSSSFLSNGARHVNWERGSPFTMTQLLFWAMTIGACATWTAIGYELARLL